MMASSTDKMQHQTQAAHHLGSRDLKELRRSVASKEERDEYVYM